MTLPCKKVQDLKYSVDSISHLPICSHIKADKMAQF